MAKCRRPGLRVEVRSSGHAIKHTSRARRRPAGRGRMNSKGAFKEGECIQGGIQKLLTSARTLLACVRYTGKRRGNS